MDNAGLSFRATLSLGREDGKTTLGQVLFMYQRLAFLLLAVSLPPVLVYELSASASVSIVTWLSVVALTALGGYFGTPILVRAYGAESRRVLYKAMVVVYAASLLEGVRKSEGAPSR